jgi:hypothetical protein
LVVGAARVILQYIEIVSKILYRSYFFMEKQRPAISPAFYGMPVAFKPNKSQVTNFFSQSLRETIVMGSHGAIILLPSRMPVLKPVSGRVTVPPEHLPRCRRHGPQARVFRATARQPEGVHLYGANGAARQGRQRGLAIDIYA